MRPVNLIPPDARRGDRAAMRTGMVSYVVIGGLALALLGAIVLAFTSKQVSDREAEVSKLEGDLQAATARAQSLQAFASFRSVQESRTATVASLAKSRFDWERVLNELALVIPSDVWLVQLGGTVSPAVDLQEGPDISTRDSVAGPALEIIGCSVGQDAVAGFVADLEDIDGVTRVGVATSERADPDSQGDAASGGGGAAAVVSDASSGENDDCRTRDFITRFEIVIAFDAVPVPETATSAPSVPAPAAPPTGDDGTQLAGSPSGEASTPAAPTDSAGAQPSTAPPLGE